MRTRGIHRPFRLVSSYATPSCLCHTDTTQVLAGGYRYGFNGKENDRETGWQDYGERMYDTRLSRFPSADPLIVYQQQYPELSPYQFASNNPIKFVDIDGLEAGEPGWGAYMGALAFTSTDAHKLEMKTQANLPWTTAYAVELGAKFSAEIAVEGINAIGRGGQMVTNPILYNITQNDRFRGTYTLLDVGKVREKGTIFDREVWGIKKSFLSAEGGDHPETWRALGDGVSIISFGASSTINVGKELGFKGVEAYVTGILIKSSVKAPLNIGIKIASEKSQESVSLNSYNKFGVSEKLKSDLDINIGFSIDSSNISKEDSRE